MSATLSRLFRLLSAAKVALITLCGLVVPIDFVSTFCTPTEVITAWEAGADYVKVFPCSALGGPSYLKALLAPFPQLKLIPTGGVTIANAADFLKAGAQALGVGSDLVNATAIAEGKPWIVTDIARAYLDVIQETRKKS